MSTTLPPDVVAYKRTPIFDQDTIPAGLQRQHATAAGVWALIVVLEGQLRLRLLDGSPPRLLEAQTPGVLAPQQPHEVEPAGPVNFFVEFYKQAPAEAEKKAATIEQGQGFGKDELVAQLNELLEAERAGARVALETARASPDPAIADLMQHIQHDEARWCAMLLRRIRSLDGAASPRMGGFYDKAMAIDDLAERIVFLNRGQGWVVRKLRELIPKVGDVSLHADLSHMLSSHVANITLANTADTRGLGVS